PGFRVRHQVRERPAVDRAQSAEHRRGGTQLEPFEPRQRGATDARAVGQVVERPSAFGTQLRKALRDAALDRVVLGRRWHRSRLHISNQRQYLYQETVSLYRDPRKLNGALTTFSTIEFDRHGTGRVPRRPK